MRLTREMRALPGVSVAAFDMILSCIRRGSLSKRMTLGQMRFVEA
jgi:hypothetical protein